MLNELSGLRSHWTKVGEWRLHARVSTHAEGPPVVLVHGLCVSSRYFVPTAAHLAPHYPVYAPDLPGWGRSDKPARVLDLPELADALAAWMRANGLDRAALIGNSMGCQIIGHLAVRHPDLVRCAVLIGPTVDRHARNAVTQGWRLAKDLLREPPWSWAIHARDFLSFGPRRTMVTLRHALDDAPEEVLRLLSVPMLVVRGAQDAIVPQRWAEDVTAQLPNGRLVVIPGAAHAVNTSTPRALVQVVRPFIDAAFADVAFAKGARVDAAAGAASAPNRLAA